MQKHRRCPALWALSSIPYDFYSCQLPDDGHTVHVFTTKQDGKFAKLQWCDQKYKDLL